METFTAPYEPEKAKVFTSSKNGVLRLPAKNALKAGHSFPGKLITALIYGTEVW